MSRRILDPSRVVVIGASGAGKTTFARELAGRMDAPHVELDAIHWLPNWTERNPDEFRSMVDRATASDRWVVDGGYVRVRDIAWKRATHLVWLNYRFPVVFSRAMRRTVRRVVTGEAIFSGNRETFRHAFLTRDGIPLWVLRTFWLRRREYPALLAEPDYAHLNVTTFAFPREASAFLERVGKAYR